MNNEKEYIYKSTVREKYGLTPKMIEELGPPDKQCPNPHYRSGPKSNLYLVSRVEEWVSNNRQRVEKAKAARAKPYVTGSSAQTGGESKQVAVSESVGGMQEVLAALWTLSRQAKRDRDKAQAYYKMATATEMGCTNPRYHGRSRHAKGRKETYYHLKGQCLAHLITDGVMRVTGLHRFGSNYAELVEGGGYRFHRPCPAPSPTPEGILDLGNETEAEPKLKNEMGIQRAVKVVRTFLEGRPLVDLYKWRRRKSPEKREVDCWSCGELGHVSRECPLDFFDDDDY